MQSFTWQGCDALAESTSTVDNRLTLKDSRDNKEYKVAKLADGNCWMTENLALNGTDDSGNPRTLTTADTNISTSEISSGSYTFPSGTDLTTNVSNSYTVPQIYISNQDNTDDNGNKYGNYYNYLAATVGVGTQSKTSGDIASSVCPKGWRLPAYEGTGSFIALGSAYSLSKSNAWNTIRTAPLYFPAAGEYDNGVHLQGSYGYYWSRRVRNADYVYRLNFYSGGYGPQDYYYRYGGFPVRCVFVPEPDGEMQTFTNDMCSNLSTTTESSDNRLLLKDTRDNKTYKIAKLADGNCWMVQNLALDGTDSNGNVRTLTSTDSDVTANRTLAANITSGSSVDNAVQIASTVANNSGCSGTYCVSTNTEKYGNLYNWYAATATTGTASLTDTDASDSVCPKGWKLPTSQANASASSSAPDKSYGKLLYSTIGFSSAYASGSTGGPYVQKMQQAPLWFSFPGYYLSRLGTQGTLGIYWSRKASTSSNGALDLDFNKDGSLNPQGSSVKNGGFSVRCVFDPPTPAMQDFTTSQCTALSTTTSTSDNRIVLRDSRDNKEYNIAKLADGNCWMVQNLALDGGRTLTTSDSDVTANRTLAANITSGDSNDTSVQIISKWAENSGCSGTNCVSGNTEKYGNFYNWYAATATTGTSSMTNSNATNSVCPKGWKLPTSQANGSASSSAPDKSYGKLIYSVTGFSSSYSLSADTYVKAMQQAPLWFSFPGYYLSDLYSQGTQGYYWSRKAYTSSSYALNLYFNTGGYLAPQFNLNKDNGLSVRCVFNG
ncbi:hypothetical protein IJ096_02785 [Candidatus Saccharibacteria bacterium]|nr:hypothetical protein [Candidatus Saccharibacteria bacterium]